MNDLRTNPRNLSQVGGAVAGSVPPQPTRPRLQQQLDQLTKVLAGCHDVTSGIESCLGRLLGDVPAAGQDANANTPVSSVEQRLTEAIIYAEYLSNRLQNAEQRLQSSV